MKLFAKLFSIFLYLFSALLFLVVILQHEEGTAIQNVTLIAYALFFILLGYVFNDLSKLSE